MYKMIIFDVDDTLYDHLLPFQRSLEKYFPQIDIAQINEVYRRFRYWSDATFSKYMTNQIGIEELRIFRCQQTMKEFGVESVSDKEASLFQADYEQQLNNITMFPEVRILLETLTNQGIPLGIITNGPVSHQSKKLVQLNALKYFATENIIISQAIGSHKPLREIFDKAAQQFKANPKETLYIGDSFENDIEGSHKAGWSSIWFNHRHRPAPAGREHLMDFEVHSPQELLEVIQGLF